MKFQLNTHDITTQKTDCLIIGLFEKGEMTPSAKKLNDLSDGYLQKILGLGDFQGKLGQTQLLFSIPAIPATRILLVGCGPNTPLSARDFRKVINASIRALNSEKIKHISTFLTELAVQKHDFAWKIKQTVEVIAETTYQFDHFKSKKETKYSLDEVILHTTKQALVASNKALDQALSIASGAELTKNLANTPSNVCTPT